MKKLELYTFKWFAFWMICMGFFSYISATLNINHYSQSATSSLYFVILTALGAYIFDKSEQLYHMHNLKPQTLIILTLLMTYLLVTYSIESLYPLHSEFRDQILLSKIYFSLFELKVSFSKLTDIMFQQILITVLILNLKKNKMPENVIIKTFAFVFGIIHFPLVFIFGLNGLLYFFFPSVIAGGIFAYLLLKYEFGFSYNFALHLGFYLILGQLMRNSGVLYV